MSDWDFDNEPAAKTDFGGGDFTGEATTNGDFTNGGVTNGDGAAHGGDGGDRTCRICNEEGHIARACPKNPNGSGCFNCGQDGHSKADCPNPRVPVGNCRFCDKEGHFAKECPDKPAELCKNCGKEGHKLVECTEPRAINRDKVETKSPEKAWEDLVAGDKERDMDDVRTAIDAYVKAVPETTWAQLEAAFRTNDFKTHIIGYEKDMTDTFTLMDLQGNLDRKFHVGLYWSAKAQRGLMKEAWPSSPEENMERLTNAGIPVDRGIPKCTNCDKMGHIRKNCPDDPVERNDIVCINCVNCDEEGHRARDCDKPRKVMGGGCRNCNQPGHKASECTEPRNMDNVQCKNCDEMGHFSKECPKREPELCRNCGEEGHRSKECENPRNMAIQVCRNCDEKGHMSKECPKPRDYSRVTCQNCGEKGHTKVRCKEPPKEADAPAFENTFDSTFDAPAEGGATDSGGFEAATTGGDGFDNGGFDAPAVDATPAVTAGGGGDDMW